MLTNLIEVIKYFLNKKVLRWLLILLILGIFLYFLIYTHLQQSDLFTLGKNFLLKNPQITKDIGEIKSIGLCYYPIYFRKSFSKEFSMTTARFGILFSGKKKEKILIVDIEKEKARDYEFVGVRVTSVIDGFNLVLPVGIVILLYLIFMVALYFTKKKLEPDYSKFLPFWARLIFHLAVYTLFFGIFLYLIFEIKKEFLNDENMRRIFKEAFWLSIGGVLALLLIFITCPEIILYFLSFYIIS